MARVDTIQEWTKHKRTPCQAVTCDSSNKCEGCKANGNETLMTIEELKKFWSE